MENQPIWLIAGGVIVGLLIKIFDSLGIGDFIKGKAGADKKCAAEVARLKFVVVKMDTTLKLIAEYLNNPENVETTQINIQNHLKEIAPIIDEIHKENEKS
jgi:hypothetical protein